MIMCNRVRDFIRPFKGRTGAYWLFERLRRYASLSATSICMLHNAEKRVPCPKSSYFCGNESQKSVINFDAVKEAFCKNNRIGAWSSVDAVTYKDKQFIFVEIKSWQNFERYQIKDSDSPEEKKEKIEKKAKGFNLKKKIEQSFQICKDISHDEHLFEKIPVIYILVTDVDTVAEPMKRFRARMGVLSYKSQNIPLYNKFSTAQLYSLGMNVRYVFCQKFDELYDGL